MDGFTVAPVELQVCGSMLGRIGDELRTEMAVLHHAMDELLTTGWRGAAATGFATGWDQWSRGARDLLDALAAMSGLLGETGRNSERTDTTGAHRLRESGADL